MAVKHGLDPGMSNHSIKEKLQLKGVLKCNPAWLQQKEYESTLTKEQREEIIQKRQSFVEELKKLESRSFLKHIANEEK